MKKLVILFVTFVFMVSGFVSCSNLTEEEKSSLTLTFNGSDFSGSSARNINISSDFSDYYLVVNVLGDYKETKEITFSSFGSYSLTFDSIPVGSKIYVEANAELTQFQLFEYQIFLLGLKMLLVCQLVSHL